MTLFEYRMKLRKMTEDQILAEGLKLNEILQAIKDERDIRKRVGRR